MNTTKTPTLWQFLLECLCIPHNAKIAAAVAWCNFENSEFYISDPSEIALTWAGVDGRRKPSNTTKTSPISSLARALRFLCSEADVITKGSGDWKYRFVPNLKELVGYSAKEMDVLSKIFSNKI